ncbi:N-acyl homoserine lactonase family protein [Salipiger sp. P9]|uniref:N-acyl homoserine lactonase family protein n=1 Tax=Salipiger pentaromativorans TaxID=2943193 RepID=UPI0021578245|nr:N-acyl homoserine lactonase family protein [Salipiger pentaromativorans]MCR8547571.1 N-acyl homoserine lactonase family protein [Salipiger pentaromativorans]
MSALRMTAMNVGPMTLEKAKLVTFAPGEVTIPTTAAVLEHPDHGVILWDTGINEAVADPERRDSYWGPGIFDAFGAHAFTRDHVIDRQLDKLGIKTSDVRYVVYSHLHLDHAGGMAHFPDAIHVAQRDELRYALFPDPWTSPVYCQNDFKSVHQLNWKLIDGDCDLFGDGSLKLIRTPGHAPGHQSLIVDLPNRGRIVLAADVSHQRDQFEAFIPMPWDWSAGAMTASRQRLMLLESGGIPAFFCHEGLDLERLPTGGTYWD